MAFDVSGQFYFNDYLFHSEKIGAYVGLGLGRYVFENKENTTFNLSKGARYWFSDHYGTSTQLVGKIGLPPVNLAISNNYQLNLGLVWRN